MSTKGHTLFFALYVVTNIMAPTIKGDSKYNAQ